MRVLLADDQTEVRWALRVLLQEEPRVDLAGEVTKTQELVRQVQLTQADLILLDWELPGRPTAAILSVLHSLPCRPKIIALSGRPEAQQAALAAGADAFVSKGDPPEQLLSVLRAICSKRNEGGARMSNLSRPNEIAYPDQVNDKTLASRVRQALFKVERLRLLHSPIQVEARDSLVTLRGVVATAELKRLALQAVHSTPGVHHVRDELLTERNLENGIAQALAADPRTHPAIIRVNATNDSVVLAGQVEGPEIAQVAETIASNMPGVRQVINHIQVVPNDSKRP